MDPMWSYQRIVRLPNDYDLGRHWISSYLVINYPPILASCRHPSRKWANSESSPKPRTSLLLPMSTSSFPDKTDCRMPTKNPLSLAPMEEAKCSYNEWFMREICQNCLNILPNADSLWTPSVWWPRPSAGSRPTWGRSRCRCSQRSLAGSVREWRTFQIIRQKLSIKLWLFELNIVTNFQFTFSVTQ